MTPVYARGAAYKEFKTAQTFHHNNAQNQLDAGLEELLNEQKLLDLEEEYLQAELERVEERKAQLVEDKKVLTLTKKDLKKEYEDTCSSWGQERIKAHPSEHFSIMVRTAYLLEATFVSHSMSSISLSLPPVSLYGFQVPELGTPGMRAFCDVVTKLLGKSKWEKMVLPFLVALSPLEKNDLGATINYYVHVFPLMVEISGWVKAVTATPEELQKTPPPIKYQRKEVLRVGYLGCRAAAPRPTRVAFILWTKILGMSRSIRSNGLLNHIMEFVGGIRSYRMDLSGEVVTKNVCPMSTDCVRIISCVAPQRYHFKHPILQQYIEAEDEEVDPGPPPPLFAATGTVMDPIQAAQHVGMTEEEMLEFIMEDQVAHAVANWIGEEDPPEWEHTELEDNGDVTETE
jgi:hypothetical protein